MVADPVAAPDSDVERLLALRTSTVHARPSSTSGSVGVLVEIGAAWMIGSRVPFVGSPPGPAAAPWVPRAFRRWRLSAEVREAGLVRGALVGEPGLGVSSFVLEALPGGAQLGGQGGGHGPRLGCLRLGAGPLLVGVRPGQGELGGEPLDVGRMGLPDLIQLRLHRGIGLPRRG